MTNSVEQAFTQSFIKQAMSNGLPEVQATRLFKIAAEKYANDWLGQLQPYIDQARSYAQQNPTAVGAIGGGLGGMAAGAGIAGEGNRLKGALGGGLAGAGLGAAGGLSMDPNMQNRLRNLMAPRGVDYSAGNQNSNQALA